jgi:hypothetical protein
MGSVQFEMLGPFKNDFLNYIRTVHASFDGSRWVFDAVGTPQDFEELDAYKAPRVRDRFTSEMLERYCKALAWTYSTRRPTDLVRCWRGAQWFPVLEK